ncbi:MAG: alpha/beta hydrolase [Holophagales bacterium]|nr:alpha/beta hydrolase [Holophagales bacterium]MYF96523.1 alpha/beta hydrolase [Holophagales bacterium]
MPRITPLSLQGPAGALQAELIEPDATASFVATVAHPHPLYGGDMDNHVVTAAANAVVELGGAALRFNFRGTGGSEGRHDEGRGETEDLGACEQELRRRFPRLPRIGIGYSFGAVVTMARLPQAEAAQDPSDGVLLIAPPLTHYDFDAATTATVPVAVVYGQLDAFTTDAMIRRLPKRWPTLDACLEIAGAGHDLSSPELGPAIRQTMEALIPDR